MNPEVKLSDSEILQLSNDGHNEIAGLASGNNILDAQKLRVASRVSRDALAREVSQMKITDPVKIGLQSLLAEVANTPGIPPVQIQPEKVAGSPSVQQAAVDAMNALKNALEPQGQPPAEFLSGWREIKAKIPSMEVGGLAEIKDALNQSRQYNKDLINYLVVESKKPDLTLSFNSWPFSNRPGMFLSFADDKFSSVEEKQKAIINALNNLESLWKDQGSDASGMGVWGWAATAIAFYLGYKVIWKGAKVVVGKAKWFGIGSAAVAAMDAVSGVAGEKTEKAKGLLKAYSEQQKAALKARGIIDPASSDFKELFDVGEKTMRADTTLSSEERARRMRALGVLQGNYITDYNAGKIRPKYVGNGIKAEVGYITNGEFGAGNIDARAGQGRLAKGGTMATEIARNTARNMPGVGRFFQGGLVGAINTAESLKTGASLDPLMILGESIEFKDGPTRNNIETIWDLSKQRAKLLRIQEKMTEFENQKSFVTQLKSQLDSTPKIIELQTESQITTLQSTSTVINQQPATQIMKRQEINPEYTSILSEYNKARNAELALTRELTSLNPNKILPTSLSAEIEARNVEIEGKIIDLRTAYPSAQVPTYDRNNKGMNYEKWVLRLARIFKK